MAGQEVLMLDDDENGNLILGQQLFYGSKDIFFEEDLKSPVEVTKTVHFKSGPKKVKLLREHEFFWIRKGDLP